MSREAGGLPERMIAIHAHLRAASIDHAFGGTLALAWCTQQARGTIDLDVNVFVGPERTDDMLAGLPDGIVASARDRDALRREGQPRLWWDATPVDVFLNTTAFHEESRPCCRGCTRPTRSRSRRGWLSEPNEVGHHDGPVVRQLTCELAGVFVSVLGNDDDRIVRLLRSALETGVGL